jgi:hypothetical protein
MTAVSPREATTKLQEEKIGVVVGGARERQQREKGEGEAEGFIERGWNAEKAGRHLRARLLAGMACQTGPQSAEKEGER